MSSISKTDYILWRACPKNAWLRIHKPDVYNSTELTEYEQSIVDMGIEVECVARGLFPDGVLVIGSRFDALQSTLGLIASNRKTFPRQLREAVLRLSRGVRINVPFLDMIQMIAKAVGIA